MISRGTNLRFAETANFLGNLLSKVTVGDDDRLSTIDHDDPLIRIFLVAWTNFDSRAWGTEHRRLLVVTEPNRSATTGTRPTRDQPTGPIVSRASSNHEAAAHSDSSGDGPSSGIGITAARRKQPMYVPDYLDGAAHDSLLIDVDSQPWLMSVDHRVQIHGCNYGSHIPQLDEPRTCCWSRGARSFFRRKLAGFGGMKFQHERLTGGRALNASFATCIPDISRRALIRLALHRSDHRTMCAPWRDGQARKTKQSKISTCPKVHLPSDVRQWPTCQIDPSSTPAIPGSVIAACAAVVATSA
jgi:hypothetical protein